jgi:hypothetical protein
MIELFTVLSLLFDLDGNRARALPTEIKKVGAPLHGFRIKFLTSRVSQL